MRKKTLCIVGGKSGGHVLPAITLAQRWKENNPAGKVLMISCGARTFSSDDNTVDIWFSINSMSTNWTGVIGKSVLALKAAYAFFQALYILLRIWPEEIISTGGIVAVPVCCAARLLRRRFVMYELNAEPGRAALFCARFCDEIDIVFERVIKDFGAYKDTCVRVDYPVRYKKEYQRIDPAEAQKKINTLLKEEANDNMLFDQQRKTIFVLGGSQGSLTLNTIIKNLIQDDLDFALSIQVIHQTGSQDSTDWAAFYHRHKIPAFVFAYHDDLSILYQAADLVISRAGAGTLFELLFFQKKSIIIPLVAKTTGHQVVNADEMATLFPQLFHVVDQPLVTVHKKIHMLLYDSLQLQESDYL